MLTMLTSMTLEVPGFRKDEIHVRLGRDSLTISASKKAKKSEKGKDFYYEESSASSIMRTMPLPAKINPSDFEVVIKDGSVVLKKKKKARV